MSTLKVTNIENPSTTSGGIDIDTSGHVTVDGVAMPSAGPLSNRNKIINGGFQVDQRNSGSAVTPAVVSSYTVDRFRVLQSVVSTLTVEQQTAVVPAGFTHAVEITLAASRTPTAAQQFFFGTTFEANNFGHLGFGAAGAVATILSFWVRASVTGTYSVSWTNDANDRSYIGTYTINAADTWEPKTVTFTGDTTGTWTNSGTARHSFLSWDLGAGSDFDGTADTWQAGNLRKTSASVDFVSGTNGDTFYLAGVQLEVGSVATPFEHRSYGDELALCERYYQVNQTELYVYYAGSATLYGPAPFRTKMRNTPSSMSVTAVSHYGNGFSTSTTTVNENGGRINYPASTAGYNGARVTYDATAEL